jgi:hypothetical protein
MTMSLSTCRRALLAGGLLAAGLGSAVLPSAPAHAALIGCNSDPQIYLSNSVKDTVSAYLPNETSTSDIQKIVYAVHIPSGVTVTSIHYTSGLASQEQVTVTADNPANVYSTTTTVYTSSAQAVQATTQAVYQTSKNSGAAAKQTVSGSNAQALAQQVSL